MTEAIANWMTSDILWLFAVPADNQPAPAPSNAAPTGRPWLGGTALRRVPVGHWAGDRVLIVDEYRGSAQENLPADLLAKFPKADPEDDVLEYVQTNLKHVNLADYEPAVEGDDALFPADRVWVVRNLTKCWYARSDVLVKEKNRQGPAATSGLGLSDLIWAEIGGATIGVGPGSVGDRFDVQTLATVENPEDGRKWADKSEKSKRRLTAFNENEVERVRGGYDDEDYDDEKEEEDED
jgi:hypothetical protein